MDKKLIFIFIAFLLIFPAVNLYAQYYLSYDFVMELADKALEQGDYKEAIHYLNIAQILRPDKDEPLLYINFIKRLKEGRVKEIPLAKPYRKVDKKKMEKKEREKKIEDSLTLLERQLRKKSKEKIILEEKLPPLIEKEKEVKKEIERKIEKEKVIEEAELAPKPVYKPGIKIVS
ncbi:MAG: hypothetical protein KJ711_08135, partial [Candidatus Omnitrophica bacterium]|nr:hypothetical protein [Candidatus Omnitrophota bacterium]